MQKDALIEIVRAVFGLVSRQPTVAGKLLYLGKAVVFFVPTIMEYRRAPDRYVSPWRKETGNWVYPMY